MLERPIFSGIIGKWAYVLIDRDLVYELKCVTRNQVIADDQILINYIKVCPCIHDLYFKESVCREKIWHRSCISFA
jgi:hypothetical protein